MRVVEKPEEDGRSEGPDAPRQTDRIGPELRADPGDDRGLRRINLGRRRRGGAAGVENEVRRETENADAAEKKRLPRSMKDAREDERGRQREGERPRSEIPRRDPEPAEERQVGNEAKGPLLSEGEDEADRSARHQACDEEARKSVAAAERESDACRGEKRMTSDPNREMS